MGKTINARLGEKTIEDWAKEFPVLKRIMAGEEVFWVNPKFKGFSEIAEKGGDPQAITLSRKDIQDSEARLRRFAPFIAKAFPETQGSGGIIESPLKDISGSYGAIAESLKRPADGFFRGTAPRLLLKCDSHLPISGSVKARGGIYEVLKHAETLVIKEGLLRPGEDYGILAEKKAKEFFSKYSLAVGSTGNLGMSIGIMGAALGLKVTVHMSSEAKDWKKKLLRRQGVNVVEHSSDYSKAVEAGRKEAEADPNMHFIDDEHSKDLFLGYSVAALRLAGQLEEQGIPVDGDHPLFVYLPCGVGGGPGGISFGLKHAFGNNVHCFFAEPTQSPCFLLGLLTGLHEKVSVYDFGLTNSTEADGLAVARPSELVGRLMEGLISGVFTVKDQTLFSLMRLIKEKEDIFLEPSALAGFPGPFLLLGTPQGRSYLEFLESRLGTRNLRERMEGSTHIIWATGGSMVPEEEQAAYLERVI
jgi:D-serine dehydratase